MKKLDSFLKEYVRKLSEEDLSYLSSRYSQNLCGDRADILNYLSSNRDLDKWMAAANNPTELFNMLDTVGEYIQSEHSKRTEKVEA